MQILLVLVLTNPWSDRYSSGFSFKEKEGSSLIKDPTPCRLLGLIKVLGLIKKVLGQ